MKLGMVGLGTMGGSMAQSSKALGEDPRLSNIAPDVAMRHQFGGHAVKPKDKDRRWKRNRTPTCLSCSAEQAI